MMGRRFAWGLLLGSALWTAGCGPGDPLPGSDVASPDLRPADGLLERPDLQAVVELELARDGAGLRARLRDEDPAVRARAAYALATVKDLGAVAELRALLADPDPRVRADAAFALAHYSGAGDAGDQMADRLAVETDPQVRAALVDALGKAGYSRSLGVLLTLDGADRAAATLALSRAVLRGSPPGAAVDTLVARMADPDPLVRRNAAYFMERVDDPSLWVDHRGPIRTALDAMPLDDPAALSLVDGLGARFDVFSLPRIVRRARWASDWRVRANAMAALEGMGQGEERLLALLNGLDDPSPHVRTQAAAVLADAPPADDVQAWLREWLRRNPRDFAAVGGVLELLARAGEADTVLGWVEGLDPEDDRGWTTAIPALRALEGEAALDALLDAAASGRPAVSRAAATALVDRVETARGFGVEAASVDLLARALDEADPGAVPLLARALADSTLRAFGGEARLASSWNGAGAARREALARGLRQAGADSLLASLGGDVDAPGPDGAGGGAPRGRAAVDWQALHALGPRPRWIVETERGTVVLELAADEAPLTVLTLSTLARDGRFDGVPFHRVVPNFVVQGGNLALGTSPEPPAPRLATELTRIPFERGVVGMASTGSQDTETSQFFITHDRTPHLDGGYTAFGWVVRGMDVVDRIVQGDRIVSVRVVPDAGDAFRTF